MYLALKQVDRYTKRQLLAKHSCAIKDLLSVFFHYFPLNHSAGTSRCDSNSHTEEEEDEKEEEEREEEEEEEEGDQLNQGNEKQKQEKVDHDGTERISRINTHSHCHITNSCCNFRIWGQRTGRRRWQNLLLWHREHHETSQRNWNTGALMRLKLATTVVMWHLRMLKARIRLENNHMRSQNWNQVPLKKVLLRIKFVEKYCIPSSKVFKNIWGKKWLNCFCSLSVLALMWLHSTEQWMFWLETTLSIPGLAYWIVARKHQ